MHHRTRTCHFLLALALAGLGASTGCDRSREPEPTPEPVVRFDSGTVEIRTAADTFRLRVEVADSPDKQQYGLMERDSLAQESGMFFVYDAQQDSSSGFWMFRTRIPLDIAFIDSTGVVVAVRSMEPCRMVYPDGCNVYRAGAPYRTALEVNRGWFERRRVGLGTRVVRVE